MKLKELFKKDITRNITGVVTIGNETEDQMVQELEEYVCTNEIISNFREFFSAYRKSIQSPTEKIGVWVTGFFGSGKSHFLKILGYILSNKMVYGKKAIDYFEDKINDQMIKADMKISSSQDNLVVLFNIDSKAKSNAKNRTASIMEIMLSCFNEKLGFCESIPWLADLERNLVQDGLYEKFKERFTEITGKDYVKKRKDVFFLRDDFIKALVDIKHISNESARAYFDDAQKNYSINIETFAKTVADYCQTNNRRVIFLMDEVGQFIGTNSEMMLGLQTIVEDLGRFANGKAWVVVTSQQDIKSFKSDNANSIQLDFSKIQGRFATRLTMSSSNADEVIKKRLLDKNDDVKDYLGVIYEKNVDKLNNLLLFPSNPKWTGYKDKNQFVDDYPFVNYQYELLQKVFDSIRENGLSNGKSISSGERSLINAFQESAKAKCNDEIGLLIPFNDFFKSAEEFMDFDIKQVFSNAKKRMIDSFDIDVLEVLFMLKGVKEMEPTIERIATLMASHIDEDKLALKNKIKASLDRLISETFAQQNGDRYEFLTNEEQDVNRKIKKSSYSQNEVYNKINQIIYDGILEIGKQYPYGKYSFGLNKYIDDIMSNNLNPDYITIKIYTPWGNKDYSYEQKSLCDNGCLVIDISNGSYIEELIQYNKIMTFDKNNSADTSLYDILQKKRAEANEREKRAKASILDCLKTADMYQYGSKLDIATNDVKKRFADGISKAIQNKYSKLEYVKYNILKNDEISSLFNESVGFTNDDFIQIDNNSKAINDILDYIKNEKNYNRQITLSKIIDKFKKAPYGYRDIDIKYMIAGLLKHVFLRIKEHGEVLKVTSSNFIYDYIRGNKEQNFIIEPIEKIDESLLIKVRMIIRNAFGRTIELNENILRKELLDFFKNKYNELNEINNYFKSYGKYPGKAQIAKMLDVYKSIIQSDDTQIIFDKIIKNEEELMDFGEIMDSILSFYKQGGSQNKIWDDAIKITDYYQNNCIYIPELKRLSDIVSKMINILNEELPFSHIQDLGQYVSSANKIKTEIIDARKLKSKEELDKYYGYIENELEESNKISFKQVDTKLKIKERYNVSIDLIKRLEEDLNCDEKIDNVSSRAKQEYEDFRDDLKKIISNDNSNDSNTSKKVVRIKSTELIPVANKKITKDTNLDDLMNGIRKKLQQLLDNNDEVDID